MLSKIGTTIRDYTKGPRMMNWNQVSLGNIPLLNQCNTVFLWYCVHELILLYMHYNCALIHHPLFCLCPHIMSIIHSIKLSLSVCQSNLLWKSHCTDSSLKLTK